jgi:hypothetical protein
VDFESGKVGFVRMVLEAGILQNSICKDEMGGDMSYKSSSNEKNYKKKR